MSPQARERIVYGLKPVLETLRSDAAQVHCLYVVHGLDGPLPREVQALAERLGVPVRTISRREMDRRAESEHHQGVMASVGSSKTAELEDLLKPGAQDLVLLADGVQDPRNLGALLRCTEFSGGRAVVIPRHGASGLSGTVAKASAGASEHVPLVTATNLGQALDALKQAGYWCYGTVAQGGEPLFRTRFNSPAAVVVGGEEKGIRPLVARKCDALVTIPRFGRVESLNVAVAAAVVLMEIRRQQAAQAG